MTDDTDRVSPKEVNARIFEIFSNMSEDENRKFLSMLISKIPEVVLTLLTSFKILVMAVSLSRPMATFMLISKSQ